MTITIRELERPLSADIYDLQKEIYQIKLRRLTELIHETLLQRDAEQRGISLKQLKDSILSEDVEITNEEVKQFYQININKLADWEGSVKDLNDKIRSYLYEHKKKDKIKTYANLLMDRSDVKIFLKEYPLPFTSIPLGNSPTLGPSDAQVTIIEFSDYLCPVCRKSHGMINKIKERYHGKVRWVFKDFPLKQPEASITLAEATRCAGDQGKFWEFQDLIFNSKEDPDLFKLQEYAEQMGLKTDLFAQCIKSGKYYPMIKNDIQNAKEAGIKATPSFTVNGKLRPGVPSFEKFKELIDKELEKIENSDE